MALAVGVVAFLVVLLVAKAARHKPFIGRQAMIGLRGEVRADGFARIEGALWKIEADDQLSEGMKIEVIGMNNLTLRVKRIG
jgi:membrane-bound ClpP family serine protease